MNIEEVRTLQRNKDVFSGLGIGSQIDGGRLGDRSEIVGCLDTFFGSPGDTSVS